jgi:hypothetical protein
LHCRGIVRLRGGRCPASRVSAETSSVDTRALVQSLVAESAVAPFLVLDIHDERLETAPLEESCP